MKSKFILTLAVSFATLLGFAITSITSSAQIAASEFGTVSQTIDGTVISMEYSRPSRRGRDPLFGGVMAYGQIITPGANMATTIEFSKDVSIDGNAVPAGKYSVWISYEKSGWEFGLDETWQRFHGPHPVMADLEVHFPVKPHEVAMEQETLTFDFPALRPDGTTLRMHWGTTAIDMEIEVPPTPLVNITEKAATPYPGKYRIQIRKSPPWAMADLTTNIDIKYEGGYLHSVIELGPYTDGHDLAFFPISDQTFYPVMLMKGVTAQSFGGMIFEFNLDSAGNAKNFEARFKDTDFLLISGTRVE